MRRIQVPYLTLGEIDLAPAQAHHLRDVLRMRAGDEVTAFDERGAAGLGVVARATADKVTIRVDSINAAKASKFSWSVAAAVPKGQRADWMVEKLAEMGTEEFIPLSAERSVSLPSGKEKFARWERLAAEAARQSGRNGVMKIGELATVAQVVNEKRRGHAWYMSVRQEATPVLALTAQARPEALVMMIGPEGGWTIEEEKTFDTAGFTGVRLCGTVLRVETAAVAAAAIVAAWAAAET